MSKDNPSQVLEATETFICEIDGERFTVHEGVTRIAAGHKLAEVHASRFKPVEQDLAYDVEEATDEPGRARARPSRPGSQRTSAASGDAA